MAVEIKMKHTTTGMVEFGFVGFSWTTLFFGPLTSLVCGDIKTFSLMAIIELLFSIFMIIPMPPLAIANSYILAAYLLLLMFGMRIGVACTYHKYRTSNLMIHGYVLADTDEQNARAKKYLRIE